MYSRYSRQINQQRKEESIGQASLKSVSYSGSTIKENAKGGDNCDQDDRVTVEDQTSQASDASNGHGTDTISLPVTGPKTQEICSAFTLSELWERLCNPPTACHSLLKRHLTPELLSQLRERVTAFGGRLEDCIRSGKFVW